MALPEAGPIIKLTEDYWAAQVEIAARLRARTSVAVTLATALVGVVGIRFASSGIPHVENVRRVLAFAGITYLFCGFLLSNRLRLRIFAWLAIALTGVFLLVIVSPFCGGLAIGAIVASLHFSCVCLIHALQPTVAVVTEDPYQGMKLARPFAPTRDLTLRLGFDVEHANPVVSDELADPPSREFDVGDAVIDELEATTGLDRTDKLTLMRLRKLLSAARRGEKQNIYRRSQLTLAEESLQKSVCLLAYGVLLGGLSLFQTAPARPPTQTSLFNVAGENAKSPILSHPSTAASRP